MAYIILMKRSGEKDREKAWVPWQDKTFPDPESARLKLVELEKARDDINTNPVYENKKTGEREARCDYVFKIGEVKEEPVGGF